MNTEGIVFWLILLAIIIFVLRLPIIIAQNQIPIKERINNYKNLKLGWFVVWFYLGYCLDFITCMATK